MVVTVPPSYQQTTDNAIIHNAIVMVDGVEKHHTPLFLTWAEAVNANQSVVTLFLLMILCRK